jgi:hypothetical protein
MWRKVLPRPPLQTQGADVIGQEEHGDEGIINEMQPEVMGSDNIIEKAVILMHVTHPNPYLKCMRFNGKIEKSPIYALIDSEKYSQFYGPKSSTRLVVSN